MNRLEGQYRVTRCLIKVVNSEELSPRKGPPCIWCSVKAVVESMKKTFVEHYNPMMKMSKVKVFN